MLTDKKKGANLMCFCGFIKMKQSELSYGVSTFAPFYYAGLISFIKVFCGDPAWEKV